jgi:hypothetical protein
MCNENNIKSENQTIGFSTVTIHLLTLLGLCVNFWLRQKDGHSHPPYSPDLAPCDFFLFPKLMMHATMIQIKSGDETPEFQTMHFTKCTAKWCNCWAHYKKSEGDYCEGGENLQSYNKCSSYGDIQSKSV